MTARNRALEVALQMVARRREHGAYGDDKNLVKALRRRIGSIDADEAVALHDRAAKLYDAAVSVAARHGPALFAARTGGPLQIPSGVRDAMRMIAPGESDDIYDETLSWVFYVNHLR